MPRPGHISARRWRQWAYESLIAVYDSTTLAPAGYVSHEGAGDAGLAGAGNGDGYRRRLRGLRPRRDRTEKSGPAERAAGLFAEPQRTREDSGSVAGGS